MRRPPLTRQLFSDHKNLLTRAKKDFDSLENKIRSWWEEKYKLPSNQDLFEKESISFHLFRYYVELCQEKHELEQEIKDNTLGRAELGKKLRKIEEALGEVKGSTTGDPLADKWEEMLARGEIPDLFKPKSELDND